MTATFTALPVGQGDSFLLEYADGRRILVDGGKAALAPAHFLMGRGVTSLDVVICTHADADHIDGLIGLMSVASIAVKEVWLPGRWAEIVAALHATARTFPTELVEEAQKVPEGVDLGAVGDQYSDDDIVDAKDIEETGAGFRVLDDALSSDPRLSWIHPVVWDHVYFDEAFGNVFVEALGTAGRIAQLTGGAYHRGCKIRWFDFDKAKEPAGPSGGDAGLLPLNSVEISSLRKRKTPRSLFRLLALSASNKQSLVFLAKPDDINGVLFSADSDLGYSSTPLPTKLPAHLVATAPHHGAESNKAAYEKILAARPESFLVRSDGNYKSRPGPSYLKQAAYRACTLCRGTSLLKSAVSLEGTASGWALMTTDRACHCK